MINFLLKKFIWGDNMKYYNRGTEIIETLQKGVEYYLDDWKDIQENENFPVNSNEEMYKAESIIKRIETIQNAILLAQMDENKYIDSLDEALKNICIFADRGYSDYCELPNR